VDRLTLHVVPVTGLGAHEIDHEGKCSCHPRLKVTPNGRPYYRHSAHGMRSQAPGAVAA
jgi:hypothetical protein